jgi:hypothetical protein
MVVEAGWGKEKGLHPANGRELSVPAPSFIKEGWITALSVQFESKKPLAHMAIIYAVFVCAVISEASRLEPFSQLTTT